MAIEDTIGNAARWYDSSRGVHVYEMKFETAYRFFCMVNANGESQNSIRVYDTSDPDTLVDTMEWHTGISTTPSAVGRYFVINDYQAAVKDVYAGIYINAIFPRYQVYNPIVYKIGFTVPSAWLTDNYPQKVEVEFFEKDDYYRLTETGLTGSYTLSTPGTNAIVWPAGSAGYHWPTIYEYCDDTYDAEGVPTNSKGLVLRMDYEAGGISMPYDFRGIMFQQPKYLNNGVRGWAALSLDPPTPNFVSGEGTATDIALRWIDTIEAAASDEMSLVSADWVIDEAHLATIITDAGHDPAQFFASAYDHDTETYTYLPVSANGSRYFAVLNLLGNSPSEYPKTGDIDIYSLIIMQCQPTYYAYTFPTDGQTNTFPNAATQQLPTGGITMEALRPAESTYGNSVFLDLPCTVFRNSSNIQNVTIKGYGSNTVINGTINHIEAQNLHCCYICGETTNLVFNRSAAWYFQIADVEIATFVKYVELVSVLSNISYYFTFSTLQYYNLMVSAPTYATLPFRTQNAEKLYQLRIFGNHGITDTLVGGASPISISEENSKFAFTQLRDQSGYIQVLNENGEDGIISQLLPEKVSDRPIGLFDTVQNKYVWLGFIKPEAFEQAMYIDRQILQLPIIGMIYASRSVGFVPPFAEDRNLTVGSLFATALYRMMSAHAIPLDSVVFDYAAQFVGGTTANPTDTSWLRARVNTDVFRNYKSDGTDEWKYSCADILRELCSFFGLTCRIDGRTVYFLALDDTIRTHTMCKMSIAELVMVGFTDDYIPAVTTVTQSAVSVFDGPFASTEAKMSLTPALSNVGVTCAKEEQSASIPLWGSFLTEKNWASIVANNNWHNTMQLDSMTTPSDDVHLLTATWREKRDTSTAGYGGWIPEARVLNTPEFETGSNFAKSIDVMTRHRYLIQNAVVSLSITTKTYNSQGVEIDPALNSVKVEVVKVADAYGEADKVLFESSIDISAKNLTLTDGATASDATGTLPPYAGRKLFEVSGSDYYNGWIYLRIRRGDSASPSTYDVITEATLHITPMLGLSQTETEFSHKIFEYAAGGSQSISTIFISSDTPSILNRVASVSHFDSNETDYNPSDALAQRMADYHGKPRKAYRLHIRGDYAASGISPLSYTTRDSVRYVPIAVESDIRTNSYILTLIEMPE